MKRETEIKIYLIYIIINIKRSENYLAPFNIDIAKKLLYNFVVPRRER